MADEDRNADAVRDAEFAAEQRQVDRVYARLDVLREEARQARRAGYRIAQAGTRAALVDRDAMVYQLGRRLRALDSEYEGLVFGRLDLRRGEEPPVLYIGRLGIRDERYQPLLVDWRAPAATPFYRATRSEPMRTVRRRVIHCVRQRVVDLQDDLLDPAAAQAGLAVLGEGALLAALSRATGHQMRDIVATIAAEQDEAIRAPGSGATLITGGPGTGKTAVALHRVAYLLYSDRGRFAGGGVLLVGPSSVFMRYIGRVLPSLGEDTAVLRSLGEVLDGVDTDRRDPAAVEAVKGSLRMRRVLSRAAQDAPPDAPTQLRLVYAGLVLRLDEAELAAARRAAHGRGTPVNQARRHARAELVAALWRRAVEIGGEDHAFDPEDFTAEVADRGELDRFLAAWWPPLTPLRVLGWLGLPGRLARYAAGVLSRRDVELIAPTFAGDGALSVADVALADELRALLGEPPKPKPSAVDPDLMLELSSFADRDDRPAPERPADYDEYSHVVVDEAQDVSPMQWRMLGRRGRYASWTIVGDPAQSAWPRPAEAERARDAALRGKRHRHFELAVNYRNSAEVFALASRVIRAAEPDLPLPTAVRGTGVEPELRAVSPDGLAGACREAVRAALDAVPGTVGVIGPDGLAEEAAGWLAGSRDESDPDRLVVLPPLAAKGLEYDAVVVLEPAAIAAGAGGTHTLYVALTRGTQRLTVLSTDPGWIAEYGDHGS